MDLEERQEKGTASGFLPPKPGSDSLLSQPPDINSSSIADRAGIDEEIVRWPALTSRSAGRTNRAGRELIQGPAQAAACSATKRRLTFMDPRTIQRNEATNRYAYEWMLNAAMIHNKTNQFSIDLIGPRGMREGPLLNSSSTSGGGGVG
ncbi:hypothetical protein SEVIR_8G086050v4 [Setaria viridis]